MKALKRTFSLTLGMLLLGSLSFAQISNLRIVKEEPVNVLPVGTKTHEVKKGETLYSISQKYGMEAGEIRMANNMTTSVIYPGDKLVIPPKGSFDTPAAAEQNPNARMTSRSLDGNTNARMAAPAANLTGQTRTITQEEPEYYTVRKGDDAFSIADTREVSVAQLREWNPGSSFAVGERVVIGKNYKQVTLPAVPQSTQPEVASRSMSARTASRGDLAALSTPSQPQTTTPAQPAYNTSQPDPGLLRPVSPASQPAYTAPATTNPVMRAAGTGNQSYDLPPVNRFGKQIIKVRYAEYGDARITSSRFYGYHKNLPIGSKVNLLIPDNAGFLEVEIVGKLAQNSPADIALSPTCVSMLEGAKAGGVATITY
ncbi:MAG: LysM peptidoglycan-binding domain-containing protein [Bacteroidota bacterium]